MVQAQPQPVQTLLLAHLPCPPGLATVPGCVPADPADYRGDVMWSAEKEHEH